MTRLEENTVILRLMRQLERVYPDIKFDKEKRDVIYLSVRCSVDAINKIQEERRKNEK